MKIAIVSTWGQPCGVAEYARRLAEAWRGMGHEIAVFAERALNTFEVPGFPCERSFMRGHDLDDLVSALKLWKPDFIDFEHEFGIFPDDTVFLTAQDEMKKVHCRTTLHTVHANGTHRAFYESVRGPIVHRRQAIAVVPKAVYLPHGCAAPTDPREARRFLSLFADDRNFVMPGFIVRSKAHAFVLHALSATRDKTLMIIGQPDPTYLDELVSFARMMGLRERVQIQAGYNPDPMAGILPTVILNTTSYNYSASGIAAACIARAVPAIAAARPIYDDLPAQASLRFDPEGSASDLAACMEAGIELRVEDLELMQALAASAAWPKVAKARLEHG